ncbi:MAG: DNA translocase FtsK 4TM domain-containing protein, partial [Pyrinomonadaceae bacterium]|nr:DNA translocase FtsK 4TM domain-containing protein [Sphingobacteriaceae bacterium]
MPVKGNQFKSNSFRDELPPKTAAKARVAKEKADILPKFSFDDGRLIKIGGLFFLILSLYFLVAFTSYLFTWQEDQSYVLDANGGWSNIFKTPSELSESGVVNPVVENWLGKFGALLSHQFIYEWFGIAAFIFIGVFFIIGYRLLFRLRIVSITKTLAYSFFLLIFISVTLAFLHSFVSDYPHFMEGEFGFWSNRLLKAQIGNTGIAGLLAFAGLTTLIIAYNIDFKLPKTEPAEIDEIYPPAYASEEVENEEDFKSRPVEFPLSKDNAEDTNTNKIKQERIVPPVEYNLDTETESVVPRSGAGEAASAVLTLNIQKSDPELTIEKNDPARELNDDERKADALVEQFGQYDPKLDLSSYQYPTLELLENYGSNKISVNTDELEANKNKIVETLNHYNIEIDKIKATIGPTVTLYEIIPAPGVRISKIKNLEDDIALSLAALGIRIIAPMPGKGTIGIEVPNQHPEMVSMRSVLATDKFQNTTMDLPIALGKTISNEVYIADLAKMPHLLVAGATGQGKSVGINAILVSLVYKLHPSQLKFVLVDPKKVELTLFRKIERHFLAKLPGEADAIITDTKKVITTLNSLCIEMDQRYDLLKNGQVRNLKEYNSKFINRKLNPEEGHRFLPFIVLVVDEFADLMMTAGKEVETPIARLAQLARAVGIHLVIATQRPSVNIITGTIKANFPARLAFRVLSK